MEREGLYLYHSNKYLTLRPNNVWWTNVHKGVRNPAYYSFIETMQSGDTTAIYGKEYCCLYLEKEYL